MLTLHAAHFLRSFRRTWTELELNMKLARERDMNNGQIKSDHISRQVASARYIFETAQADPADGAGEVQSYPTD